MWDGSAWRRTHPSPSTMHVCVSSSAAASHASRGSTTPRWRDDTTTRIARSGTAPKSSPAASVLALGVAALRTGPVLRSMQRVYVGVGGCAGGGGGGGLRAMRRLLRGHWHARSMSDGRAVRHALAAVLSPPCTPSQQPVATHTSQPRWIAVLPRAASRAFASSTGDRCGDVVYCRFTVKHRGCAPLCCSDVAVPHAILKPETRLSRSVRRGCGVEGVAALTDCLACAVDVWLQTGSASRRLAAMLAVSLDETQVAHAPVEVRHSRSSRHQRRPRHRHHRHRRRRRQRLRGHKPPRVLPPSHTRPTTTTSTTRRARRRLRRSRTARARGSSLPQR